jgi:hypothetical protein
MFGVLNDEVDEDGVVTKEGAATILARAINAESEVDAIGNATIHDHLGDTYWWLERFDDALTAWLDSEKTLRSQMKMETTREDINTEVVERFSDQLRLIRLKIADAESARAPAITPIPDWSTPIPVMTENEVDPGK